MVVAFAGTSAPRSVSRNYDTMAAITVRTITMMRLAGAGASAIIGAKVVATLPKVTETPIAVETNIVG